MALVDIGHFQVTEVYHICLVCYMELNSFAELAVAMGEGTQEAYQHATAVVVYFSGVVSLAAAYADSVVVAYFYSIFFSVDL